MTVYMLDSTRPESVPAWAQIVAGYIDGLYNDFAGMKAAHPNAYAVSITVLGTPGARVCDCENGDLTPAQAAGWALREVQAHRRPTIYCNLDTYKSVVLALAAVGLQFVRDVDWWAAGYTGSPYLAAGSVATQYAGGISAPYDISTTNGQWPMAAAPTAPAGPPPVATLPQGAHCGMAVTPTGKGYWLVTTGGAVHPHGDAANLGQQFGKPLAKPVVGIAARPQGGYWLAAADGGVFSFGAPFLGSAGNIRLAQPVVGICSSPSGLGYGLTAADGGVFSYGDFQFEGSDA